MQSHGGFVTLKGKLCRMYKGLEKEVKIFRGFAKNFVSCKPTERVGRGSHFAEEGKTSQTLFRPDGKLAKKAASRKGKERKEIPSSKNGRKRTGEEG